MAGFEYPESVMRSSLGSHIQWYSHRFEKTCVLLGICDSNWVNHLSFRACSLQLTRVFEHKDTNVPQPELVFFFNKRLESQGKHIQIVEIIQTIVRKQVTYLVKHPKFLDNKTN